MALKAKAPIAEEALRQIAALYAIEAEIRGTLPEQRFAERRSRSRPLVGDLFAWFEVMQAKLLSCSTMADAIRYALNRRDGLVRFLDDGRIELDNNTVERAARSVALGRKNALLASGDDGGARWAAVASLVETCKLNGVDPQRYFTDVLNRLVNGWPNSSIDELMPWCWADPTRPDRHAYAPGSSRCAYGPVGTSSPRRLVAQLRRIGPIRDARSTPDWSCQAGLSTPDWSCILIRDTRFSYRGAALPSQP
ncbi:IS66 C-terminal element [Falsiroseomonas stagni DSM 19981]|uniref:IS66 C-terminal element n=1 Tax=Falsiroseomonas stagni DSM 19981 TaxID=1123062 RepID=A0A1I3XET8_9PROT|nr:IS66 C-terminal element [Falsiroseomonas stagni DSM 19981]